MALKQDFFSLLSVFHGGFDFKKLSFVFSFEYMIKMFHVFTFMFLLLSSILVEADEKVITISVANFPPYSIVQGDEFSGVEVELIHESLAILGYKTRFVSYPYGRLPASFKNEQIDATIVTLERFEGIDVYYSDIVLPQYQTVAIHLKRKNLSISKISDLADLSIIAHQRASLFYGEDYKEIADFNKNRSMYQETDRQDSQVKMLFKERTQVIVLAHEIFMFYKEKAHANSVNEEVVISKIFGDKFGFYNVFREQKVRDDFNKGLAMIKDNGAYHRILERYLQTY